MSHCRTALKVALIAALFADVAIAQMMNVVPCAEVKGFAGEVNSRFTLEHGAGIRDGEALILALRPVPYTAGVGYVEAQINATFTMMTGGFAVPVLSDNSGIVQITDQIDTGAPITVDITNKRLDGSTPFVFYSFHSGYPECSLNLSPQSSFTGPLPTHIWKSDNFVELYLKSVPPAEAESFSLTVVGHVSITYSRDQTQSSSFVPVTFPTVPLVRGSQPIFFKVRADPTAPPTQMIHIGITYATQSEQSNPITPPPPVANGAPVPTAPSSSPDTSAQKAEEGMGIFTFVVLAIAVYFVLGTFYNYRVRHITSYPEYIPHHEGISSAWRFCTNFVSHMRSRGPAPGMFRTSRGNGYSEVNADES